MDVVDHAMLEAANSRDGEYLLVCETIEEARMVSLTADVRGGQKWPRIRATAGWLVGCPVVRFLRRRPIEAIADA